MSIQFIHLHLHTHYSLLESTIRLEKLVARLQEVGQNACAITDHHNMFGVIQFYHSLKRNGLKPIIGQGLWVKNEHQTPATALQLLCLNKPGYQNLIRLSSLAYQNPGHTPYVLAEQLAKHHQGLVAFSELSLNAGKIPILQDEAAEKTVGFYQQIFGERYYLELQPNYSTPQAERNTKTIALATKLGVPLLATNNCSYLAEQDAHAQHVLRLIGMQKNIKDHPESEINQFFLKSNEQMAQCLQGLPSASWENTHKIAELCDLNLDNNRYYLPKFPLEKGQTEEQQFRQNANTGLNKRLAELQKTYHWTAEETVAKTTEYQKRLEHEIKTILSMGYPGYFLIVADFVNWSKQHGIPVGPGRGSGAGSLVAYSLGITDVDPLPYGLLFERFLNLERVSMPDFDIDFEARGRNRVIEYVKQKYGTGKVCQISALGHLQARGAIRAVGRALGLNYSVADKVARLVPNQLNIQLKDALKKELELENLHKHGTEDEKKLLSLAIELEGLSSNLTTHAAGVIILDSDIDQVMPTCTASGTDLVQSQYTMQDAEDQGAVKFDFLGLRNLSILQETMKLVQVSNPDLDLKTLPLDDAKTFELLSSADTKGVFQMESDGIRALLRKLKPDRFEDVVAVVALYRPGPLGSGMVDDFINRKHGRAKIESLHPWLDEILKESYGIILYQEQAMQAAQILANYSLGQADELRQAIGKKKVKELENHKSRFIEGCLNNNIKASKAQQIFTLIEYFGGYGFNKSHSVAYGLIAHQTAYLKAHYPVEFMTALCNIDLERPESLQEIVFDCRRMNINILPPCINHSAAGFTAQKMEIRYGLKAVKHVGQSAVDHLLEIRAKEGPFKQLLDLFIQTSKSKISAKVWEMWVNSGALDCLEPNRNHCHTHLEEILKIAEKSKSKNTKNQLSLFENLDPKNLQPKLVLLPTAGWGLKQQLEQERLALGFYLSDSQLGIYATDLQSKTGWQNLVSLQQISKNKGVEVVAVVVATKFRLSRNNQKMAFIMLEDQTQRLEAWLSSAAFEKHHNMLNIGEAVWLSGLWKSNKGQKRLIVEKVQMLHQMRQEQAQRLKLWVGQNPDLEKLNQLKSLCQRKPGNCQVFLLVQVQENSVEFLLEHRIQPDQEFCTLVEQQWGLKNSHFFYN